SARENIELPMRELGIQQSERQKRSMELLEYVGLGDRKNHRPSQLSGGEMQRVAIARALANRPKLLLADEPTGELDAATGEEIARLFERFNNDGLTLVVVTHNMELAASAQQVRHMRDGKWE
ncbi:ATP-binding cassette domain-containing protein, partial [bacterium]|nr:ATP-binding cassette domain-containing protein [bacterium]